MKVMSRKANIAVVPNIAAVGCLQIKLKFTKNRIENSNIQNPQSKNGRTYPRGFGGATAWADWLRLTVEYKGPE